MEIDIDVENIEVPRNLMDYQTIKNSDLSSELMGLELYYWLKVLSSISGDLYNKNRVTNLCMLKHHGVFRDYDGGGNWKIIDKDKLFMTRMMMDNGKF